MLLKAATVLAFILVRFFSSVPLLRFLTLHRPSPSTAAAALHGTTSSLNPTSQTPTTSAATGPPTAPSSQIPPPTTSTFAKTFSFGTTSMSRVPSRTASSSSAATRTEKPGTPSWAPSLTPPRAGHLFLYVPTTAIVHRVTLKDYPAGHDFHPLGMDVYPSTNGSSSTLFIVNHAREETTIEQFVLDPGHPTEAQYIRTLRAPQFVSPNALAMTSPTSFYVSNDHAVTRRVPGVGHVLPVVESIGGFPLSWVAHVSLDDGDAGTLTHTVVARGIAFANGVARSPDHTQLAVVSTSLGLVHLYTIDDSVTGALTFSHSVPVPFFPDNIMYDDTGALVVAGHPHFPSLVAVAANKSGAMAGSWAVSLTPLSNTTHFASESDARKRAYDERAPTSAAKFAPAVTTHEVETLFQSDGSGVWDVVDDVEGCEDGYDLCRGAVRTGCAGVSSACLN
ncbi:hypothetical protein JVU11DRAFT_3933 [Chiua virens]|nr:hypothetical protein JVU11DRAFT_3933 [Chiua virens]